ncbi:sulfite exporter TauE/SafE family protein [Microbacterium elymi]|uniref:Probable membrane transporter protein n=1 Tax=Microbacterium elymi TaxID=2909587 RepID=A0ABY5NHE9_9MICO|nr:sulfite exporter TauE/SafE family protein [Microbacterium elymi]UUT34554.1 sulfite exporter TauE/SafE family protein [Microbacterium elymi]
MPELSALVWVALAVGAAVIGLSKAALPGAATLAVALFAAVLPAKQSTGTILVLLIVGDVFALWAYRRHADIRTLIRLAPAVIVGLVGGAVFLAFASDTWVRRMIAILLLTVVAVSLWRRARQARREAAPGTAGSHQPAPGTAGSHRAAAATYGSLAGFTTMVANAAGPVMSMYFLAARFPVKAFLGTSAWFFAIVNVTKLPFSIGLGLITPSGLLVDLVLIPVVVGAAFVGRAIAGRISQVLFDRIIITLTVVGSLYLLV